MGKHINYAPFLDETPWGRTETDKPRHVTNTVCGDGILTVMSLSELHALSRECAFVVKQLARNNMSRARVTRACYEINDAIWNAV